MTRSTRLVFLALSLFVLLAVGWLTTGSFNFALDDFWFSAGILLLILLSVVDQPHFSKDANIFMNGTAGLISLIGVPSVDRDYLWGLFFFWSLYLIASSYCVMMIRSRPLASESTWVQLTSRINRQIGRPEALFSAFFLWGVFTQFTSNDQAYRVLLLFWAVFMVLNLPIIGATISQAFQSRKVDTDALEGYVTGFASPRLFECRLGASHDPLQAGVVVTIFAPSGVAAASAVVIDDRILHKARVVKLAVSSFAEGWTQIADELHSGKAKISVAKSNSTDIARAPVGVVCPGSTIGVLKVKIHPDTPMSEGEVLTVRFPGGSDAYYQVVSGMLTEDSQEPDQTLQTVEVRASHLGHWNQDRGTFEPITWVAPSGALVTRAADQELPNLELADDRLPIGRIPNSEFPIHVGIDDAITHNTAVIGVTGSGKSYLSLWLIEGALRKGIRVLILDVSRQHWSFLRRHNPYPLRQPQELDAWFESDRLLAVHQFAQSNSYPQTTADFAQAVFAKLEQSVQLRPGINEPAKIMVVFEEAHSLIPEWNQVAVQADTSHVNRTARTILQGRKFGMGCLVISQRTANITKTILNQCNTIFALQSFDQTGLDFLGNYMGAEYAGVISTLPPRHAVLVGKASSSLRPVMFKIQDLGQQWAELEAPDEDSTQDDE